MSEKQTVDKTKGQELQVACAGDCSGATYHKVISSVDLDGHVTDGGYDFYWDSHHQIIQCQGCKTFSFRKASSNSEDMEPISHEEWEYVTYEDLYPSRVLGRNDLSDELYFLPTNIQRIYKETLQALNANSPVLAGIGLRAIIETVCKEKSASGGNLYQKIDDLVVKKILTPAGASILHKIRTLGNDAAHEVKPHSEKQLGLAMDVAEHVLKDVYIIPKKVELEF